MLLLLLVAMVATATVAGASGDRFILTKPIIENPPVMPLGAARTWSSPAIQGNWAVYQERLIDTDPGTPGDQTGDWDVYAVNLTNGARERCSSVATGHQQEPRIYGNWVVYEDYRNGNWDVYAYNVSTNVEKRLATSTESQLNPDISGNLVVYQDYSSANKESVRVYDLSKMALVKTIDDPNVQSYPEISGSRIMYWQYPELEFRVYNLADASTKKIPIGATVMAGWDIDGTRCVWSDTSGGDWDLYVHDLLTGTKTQVTDNAETESNPSISGNKVVYQTSGNGTDVIIHDLALKLDHPVGSTAGYEAQPCISGSRAVFQFGTSGAAEIDLSVITMPVLTLSGASTVGYNATTTLTGKASERGIPMAGVTVFLQKSLDGEHWSNASSKITTSDGSYSFTTPKLAKATKFRVWFPGQSSPGMGPSPETLLKFSNTSGVKLVKPKASLTLPSGPASIAHGKSFTSTGYLKPRHTQGTKPVRIQCYKLVSGKWSLRTTFYAKVIDYSSYSKYSASVKLSSAGKWRIRAYYAETPTNATVATGYRYITAN